MSTSWRDRYEVWCQAEGRDRDDREYAARCLVCPAPQSSGRYGTSPWLFDSAGSRKEAWELCLEHERKVHGAAEGKETK